jgi:hypothetical protein
MGADVKQTASSSATRQVPALAGQGGEPEILRGRIAGLLQGSSRLLLEIGIIKQIPDIAASSTPASSSRWSILPERPVLVLHRGGRRHTGSWLDELAGPDPIGPHASPSRACLTRRVSCSAACSLCCSSPAWAWATLGGYVTRTFLADPADHGA